MKKLVSLLIGGSLVLAANAVFANEKTDLTNKWSCTTNASTASTDADKAADDKMAKNQTSAAGAFAMAAENCRDCTKITCEMND